MAKESKFRLATPEELESYGISVENASKKSEWLITVLQPMFADSISSVTVRYNTEYDDSYHSVRGCFIEVYNKKDEPIAPKKEKMAQFRELCDKSLFLEKDYDLFDAPDDVIIRTSLPELYVKCE